MRAHEPTVRTVYDSGRIRLLQSTTASSKAEFSSSVQLYPDHETILRMLKANLEAIHGSVMRAVKGRPLARAARAAAEMPATRGPTAKKAAVASTLAKSAGSEDRSERRE